RVTPICPPSSTFFPYTTLFRSGDERDGVDDVGADVAERAGARLVLLQPPHERELGIDDPVLQVLGADVADLADLPVGDEPPGERSEEHTSELQSRENLVCRLLL